MKTDFFQSCGHCWFFQVCWHTKMQYLGAISKMTRMISVHFQGKPFNITAIQVYDPTSNAEEAKGRKLRNTWNNRQFWPWNTKWSRAKANRVLPREHTGHSKHPLPTTHEKTLRMDITKWSIPKSYWLYSLQPKMEKIYTVSKKRPRADCGSDHELLIAKFRLKL